MWVKCPNCQTATWHKSWTLYAFILRFASLEPGRTYWSPLPNTGLSFVVSRAKCPECGQVVQLPESITITQQDDPDAVREQALQPFAISRKAA